ncbi:MAG: shikimate dehydrogenase [Vulcanococcus sp.]
MDPIPSSNAGTARVIGGDTRLLAVLGDPVRHSLSPVMHNAALRAMGFDWVFLALPAPAGELPTVVRALEALECRGLNVTIPHKHNVAALCRELSPLAQRLGAVNVLVPLEGGGWHGTNTDVEGFCAPLQRDGRPWHGHRAVVLGCGGSARAVVAGLVELGCGEITLTGRRPEALAEFQADVRAWAPQLQTLLWGDGLAQALAAADLVVNTTPVGMASSQDPGASQRSPLDAAELAALRPEAWVYDIIYTPRPTALLHQAAARGCRTFDGLEMLVEQGAAALRLWSGQAEVPVDVMRQALLERLP